MYEGGRLKASTTIPVRHRPLVALRPIAETARFSGEAVVAAAMKIFMVSLRNG